MSPGGEHEPAPARDVPERLHALPVVGQDDPREILGVDLDAVATAEDPRLCGASGTFSASASSTRTVMVVASIARTATTWLTAGCAAAS